LLEAQQLLDARILGAAEAVGRGKWHGREDTGAMPEPNPGHGASVGRRITFATNEIKD
jgi:hypothetical protein